MTGASHPSLALGHSSGQLTVLVLRYHRLLHLILQKNLLPILQLILRVNLQARDKFQFPLQ